MSLFDNKINWMLAPLSPSEIELAFSKIPAYLQENVATVSIDLVEPNKQIILALMQGQFVEREDIKREAEIIVIDYKSGKSYEIIVDLESDYMKSTTIRGQPAHSIAEYRLAEVLVKNSLEIKQVLSSKGYDINKVNVDLWAAGAGYFGEHESDSDPSKRLGKPLLFYVENPGDNIYARPIRGITPVLDLLKKEILRIDYYDDIYIPDAKAKYFEEGSLDYSLKPLHITQPQGASFIVDGHTIKWGPWEFRVGFDTRDGVILRTVFFTDPITKEKRPILYRASLAEMVVPYGDPSRPAYRKNAFDVGEDGIGRNLNSLERGCDCKGEIFYFDVSFCDSNGKAEVIKQAICLHEEDYGLLYKHTDWRTQEAHRIRSRRLVLSCFSTVANYDYGFNWHFYLDGRIEYEVKMTGTVSTESIGSHTADPDYKYGTKLDDDLYAPIHQHFFNMRIDFNVDGENNRVYEVNTTTDSVADTLNTQGNAYSAKFSLLSKESDSARDICSDTNRFWLISSTKKNKLSKRTSYALLPETNTFLKVSDKAAISTRANHLNNHFYCTRFSQSELYSGGKYPNMRAKSAGVTEFIKKDRNIIDKDIVVWYNFGALHIVRPEEWPIMPVANARFTLVPFGFFDRNPTLYKPNTTQIVFFIIY